MNKILMKIIKQDNSIVKLNISNLYKGIITIESFLFQKRKVLFQLTVDNKVSALPRLTSDENLLTGQATSVHCLQ